MPLRRVLQVLCLLFLSAGASLPCAAGEANDASRPPGDTAVTLYVGQSITSNFTSIFYSPWAAEFDDVYLVTAALSQRLFTLGEHWSFEIEGNVGRRFGEDVWEFNAAAILRWDGFPWSDTVYTTIGVAFLGPSYATRISRNEKRKSGNDRGSKLLNFFAPEITIADPENKNLELVTRLHHRSGVFGTFDGVSGGSNFLSLGMRYRF